MANRDEWLENLKPGDTVIVSFRGERILRQVEKVGKLHITVDGDKYRKNSGVQAGDGRWYYRSLHEVTPEKIAEMKEEQRRAILLAKLNREVMWKDYPTDTLARVVAIVEEAEAKNAPTTGGE